MTLVVAVVPTYRPESAALQVLVASLQTQGAAVVVADDASPCTVDRVLDELSEQGVSVVRHEVNAGIARSLNAGLRIARVDGARWLLTVDQDSMLPGDYLARIMAAAETAVAVLGPHAVGAVGAGSIDDASGRLRYPVRWVDDLPLTDEVIQTGTLWSVDALLRIGGFDEQLAIDAVDAAACLRLREHGRAVALAPEVSLQHALGAGRQVRILGRDVLVSGHSPERRTRIVRNRLRLFPAEFRQSPVHAMRTLRRVAVNTALAVLAEEDAWAKARASARGLAPDR